jgi:hypothetical protein
MILISKPLAVGLASALLAVFFGQAAPATAHIDLISPKPLMDGRAMNRRALKIAPFGAPRLDVVAAPATTVKAGALLDVEIEVYVYHPGEIVFLYTEDLSGADMEPAYSIAGPERPIPHRNLIHRIDVPPRGQHKMIRTKVPLPDIEGTILLVVRQVMTDKLDPLPDGSVSLKRIYYHQAAKLKLVR